MYSICILSLLFLHYSTLPFISLLIKKRLHEKFITSHTAFCILDICINTFILLLTKIRNLTVSIYRHCMETDFPNNLYFNQAFVLGINYSRPLYFALTAHDFHSQQPHHVQ